MKKIKFFAMAAVFTIGIGGAVIASNTTQTANVQNNGTADNPQWVPLEDNNGCDGGTMRPCTGYQAFENGPVTPISFGDKL
ncbi:hypothetical protein FAZ19_15760 [Sphingobacterium alkalisoli]|uniref:Uncharacterized protein n=1 Tax=Sphingobacterium alkalisoli TaxID=1874115 RepID=A0A4U0GX46_9SPHI|nr:hypothetical protein [Sphingobacterium alkalisoli]TJY63725.1 hypothetical protein FAZ19_15760 [Sphingobacterium alkalisoli]GGH25278.1 hypothetical protein GCM10011418_33790 [Sphingobacterium alkalisoli]